MSWNLSTKATRGEARSAFAAAHREQHAYQTDGAHKELMDKIAAFAADVAEDAPEGSEISLSSSGHVGSDGLGSCSVSLSIGKPVPAS